MTTTAASTLASTLAMSTASSMASNAATIMSTASTMSKPSMLAMAVMGSATPESSLDATSPLVDMEAARREAEVILPPSEAFATAASRLTDTVALLLERAVLALDGLVCELRSSQAPTGLASSLAAIAHRVCTTPPTPTGARNALTALELARTLLGDSVLKDSTHVTRSLAQLENLSTALDELITPLRTYLDLQSRPLNELSLSLVTLTSAAELRCGRRPNTPDAPWSSLASIADVALLDPGILDVLAGMLDVPTALLASLASLEGLTVADAAAAARAADSPSLLV